MAVMAVAPCADAVEIDTHQTEQQIVQVSSNPVNSDCGMDQHQEACSPLCPCQCCPSVASDTPVLSELNAAVPSVRTVHKKANLFTALPDIIWSPPQLLS